jgi:hypothetical protein
MRSSALPSILFALMFLVAGTRPAWAQTTEANQSSRPVAREELVPSDTAQTPEPTQPIAPPPKAFEYSDAYRTRAKIHKIASFATLPLFATEAVLGQSLYSSESNSKKDAHLVVAGAIGALFTVNTVTGVWNLVEARKDPNHRGRRLLHGLLMLGADAGFLATAALGPESENGIRQESASTHRAVAFTSIGLATASYLVMLFGGH